FADAHFGLGLVLAAEGRTTDAIAALRAAVAAAPDWPIATEALAWLLATRDDGAAGDAHDAVALAERARTAAGHDDARLLDTLAAAYAASGRFADAADAARRAAAVARRNGDEAFAADVETRLARYESGQPVRSAARVAPR
ncbi:MAG TPA: spermidine synthase, partial [Candidatus Binatia bacterium]|nr:spermidine synthase [Candidatus Binatia bacterium]